MYKLSQDEVHISRQNRCSSSTWRPRRGVGALVLPALQTARLRNEPPNRKCQFKDANLRPAPQPETGTQQRYKTNNEWLNNVQNVLGTLTIYICAKNSKTISICAKSIDPNQTVSALTWAAPAPPPPARPRRSTSCPASPRPPHSQTPPSTRTCWSRQVGRSVNTGAHFTVCGSNLSSSRFVCELWLLSRARPSPLLTNGQWTLWTVRTGGTNARQLLVTLLCCTVWALLEIVCWWLTQIDWVDERCVAAGGNLAASRPATAPTPARTNHLSPTTLFTVNSYHLWNDFYVLSALFSPSIRKSYVDCGLDCQYMMNYCEYDTENTV